jgi:hypothetical protein
MTKHLLLNSMALFHKAHAVLNKHECDQKLPQESKQIKRFQNAIKEMAIRDFHEAYFFPKLPIFKQRNMHRLEVPSSMPHQGK